MSEEENNNETTAAAVAAGFDLFAGEPETQPCPHCGRLLLTRRGMWLLDEKPELEEHPTECTCPAAVLEREAEDARRDAERKAAAEKKQTRGFLALLEDSGMPAEWQARGLPVFDRSTDARAAAWEACRRSGSAICGNTPAEGAVGLFIAGDIGTGKTFFASCFAVSLMRRGVPVKWANVADVLREIRATFGGQVREAEVIARYVKPPVLFLDDLGKERPTEWALEQLFAVVNARYDAGRALVVTSNYSMQELVQRLTPRPDVNGYSDSTTARAVVDRLRAMCERVVLDGKSRR